MNVTVHILLFKCILLAIKTENGNIRDRWKRTAFSFQSPDDFIRYPCPLFGDHFNKPAAVALQVNFTFSIQTSAFVLRNPEHLPHPTPQEPGRFLRINNNKHTAKDVLNNGFTQKPKTASSKAHHHLQETSGKVGFVSSRVGGEITLSLTTM